MTDSGELTRRTLLGATAAAGLASVTAGAGGQRTVSTGEVTPEVDLADYTNRTGRVMSEGLDAAFVDWGTGDITISELDAVIDAFADGERITEDGISVIPLDDDIDEDTILEAEPDDEPAYTPGDQVVYQVQSGTIEVEARLTIEPGVAIEFGQGAELEIDSDGTLIAEGTASDDILLTGTRGLRGWWEGLEIDSVDLDNVIEHVTVEYGGGNGEACMYVDDGLIEASECTFRHSRQYGLWLSGGSELASGSGENTYTENRAGAAIARTDNMHTLSGTSTFQGNDENRDFVRIVITGLDGDGPDESTRTWESLDVPYRMDGEDDVEDIELIIEEGAEFEFTQASRLRFDEGTRLKCEGTEEAPILFTATDKQRGWWDGLRLTSVDTENVMRHTTVEYGGNGLRGNLALATGRNSAQLEITDCTFRESADYGMWVENPTELEEARNTYTANANGAVRISTSNLHQLSETSTFQGNDDEYVLVNDTDIDGDGPDESQRTWDAIDVPYRMDGDGHEVEDMELIIQHGATFEFTEAGRLRFDEGTRMTISGFDPEAPEGEKIDPITFTGTTKQRGWWDGLRVTTEDGENLMEYVNIEYGGNNLRGNLALATGRNSSDLELRNCRLRHSGDYGMWVENPTELEEFGNEYTDNAEGAVRISSENIHMLSSSSTFSGNDDDYVLVNDSDVENGDQTWDALDVPYRMDGDDHTVDEIRVDVNPGAEFEFTESSRLRFDEDSSFGIQGTQEEPIIFTGTDETRGWWDGIRVSTTSTTNVMEHVIVEYGGDDLPGTFNVATGSNAGNIQQMQNCTFRHSGGYGLYAADGSTFLDNDANSYTNNVEGAARFRTQNLHYLSANSDFKGNDDDVVQVVGEELEEDDIPPGVDEAVWDGINVPYRFDDNEVEIEAPLKIEPGAELRFEEFGRIRFEEESTLEIVGTQDEPILFTASDDRPDFIEDGWWDGIRITSPSGVNQMQWVEIEYGGNDPSNAPQGLVDVGGGSRDDGNVNVTDCTFRNSQGDGIFVDEDSSVNQGVCEDNEFESDTILGVDCNVQ